MQSYWHERDAVRRGREEERIIAEAEKLEIAKSLLQANMLPDIVAKHVKLPIDEVKKLASEMK